MKTKNAVSLGEALEALFSASSLGDGLKEQRTIDLWPQVAGPLLSSHTSRVWCHNGVLCVELTSSAALDSALSQRQAFIDALNKQLGSNYVRDLVLRR